MRKQTIGDRILIHQCCKGGGGSGGSGKGGGGGGETTKKKIDELRNLVNKRAEQNGRNVEDLAKEMNLDLRQKTSWTTLYNELGRIARS